MGNLLFSVQTKSIYQVIIGTKSFDLKMPQIFTKNYLKAFKSIKSIFCNALLSWVNLRYISRNYGIWLFNVKIILKN